VAVRAPAEVLLVHQHRPGEQVVAGEEPTQAGARLGVEQAGQQQAAVPRPPVAQDVPFESGQSVLDGLRWIRANCDPSLAIRFSCINANACKECMIQVDGKTVYACTTRLAEREMTLEPLPNKTLVKDLVTEIAPPDERLEELNRPRKP